MKKSISGLLIFAAFITFTNCKKKETSSATPVYPVEVRMTDAAGPYDAVNVDVQKVEVNASNGNGGWITLNTRAGIYDLTKLTNGVDTFLASGGIPSGEISQIRLVLGTNNTVVVAGQSYPLATPSAQQSGLKLQVHETLTPNITYQILLDFDAARSIVQEGNGSYSLKPVIRTTTKATSGAIKGVVSPAAARPAVYAIMGTDTFSSLADTTGHFVVGGLTKAGSYNVLFKPKSPYSNKTVTGVNVTIGQVTDMGTVSIP